MEATRTRIDAFRWTIAASGYETIRTNTIGLAFGRIRRDLTYLEVTAADYRLAAAGLLAANEALWQREEESVGTRELTPEEVALQEERSRLAHVVFLRIDTLYFVGQRLLDGVVAAADTLLTPNHGRPRGQKDLGRHRTVKARLEERIKAGLAPPASAALFSLIDEATEEIKKHRDDYVAHPAAPTFPESQPTVRIGADGHEVINDCPSGSKPTESVTNLLVRYVNAWLDYLETVQLPFEWRTLQHSPGVTE